MVPAIYSGGMDANGNPVGDANYDICESALGRRASHGCVRVQRQANADGYSHTWLWNNLRGQKNVKIIIWDDDGRKLTETDASTPMYYNKNGGKKYHTKDVYKRQAQYIDWYGAIPAGPRVTQCELLADTELSPRRSLMISGVGAADYELRKRNLALLTVHGPMRPKGAQAWGQIRTSGLSSVRPVEILRALWGEGECNVKSMVCLLYTSRCV